VFHEQLAKLAPQDVHKYRADAWVSNHPDTEPYFLEYLPLLKAEGGARNYDAGMAFASMIPAGGFSGCLSAAECSYIETLLAVARSKERRPVLTCCRSLGRIGAIKRGFGGHTIFLYRNLFHQWLSYLSQYYGGNPYFINTLGYTLKENRHDSYFDRLADRCLSENVSDRVGFGPFVSFDAAFDAFVGVHLYLYLNASMEAAQIVNVNRLARDNAYLRQTQEQLLDASGLRLDLSDVREQIDSTGVAPFAPTDVAARLQGALDNVANSLSILEGSQAGTFGAELIRDYVEEQRMYELYTRRIRALLGAAQVSSLDHPDLKPTGREPEPIQNGRTEFFVRPVRFALKRFRQP